MGNSYTTLNVSKCPLSAQGIPPTGQAHLSALLRSGTDVGCFLCFFHLIKRTWENIFFKLWIFIKTSMNIFEPWFFLKVWTFFEIMNTLYKFTNIFGNYELFPNQLTFFEIGEQFFKYKNNFFYDEHVLKCMIFFGIHEFFEPATIFWIANLFSNLVIIS